MLHHKIYGAGPPLLVLHGLFGMLDNWQTLARRWAEDFTVVLADLPNHGRSPHDEEITYARMAESVVELMDELFIHDAAVLGHSMGGKVAMQLALTHPDKVSKLIVVDMAPRKYRRGHDDIFAALHSLDVANLGSRKEAASQLAEHVAHPSVRAFLLKNLGRAEEGFAWKMNLPALHRHYDRLVDALAAAEPFPHPALFLRGANSGYVQDEDMELILQLFPQATLETVEKAGHWVHAERPDEVERLVREFVK